MIVIFALFKYAFSAWIVASFVIFGFLYLPHAFGQSAKEKNAGGMSAKMTPSAVLVIQNGMTKVVNIKHQDALTKVLDMAPDLVNKFVGGSTGPIDAETMQTAEKMAGEMEEKK